MEEEAAVWIDLFVWMVGLQCPSHLCVDFAPLRLLYLVFIYKSIRKKNTQLGDMYRNIDKRDSPSNTQPGGGSIEQCRLNRSKWVNKTFEMHFGVMVLYGFWSYSIICPTFSLSCCTFFGLCCTDSHVYSLWRWSILLPAEDEPHCSRNGHLTLAGRQWEGNYFKSLSILAVKYHFSLKWLAQF